MATAVARLLCMASLLLITACGSKGVDGENEKKSGEWPWESAGLPCNDRCTEAEAMKAFVQAVAFCRQLQNQYERNGFYATSSKFWIGALGTLSGAVFAPIAEGTAKTAWSGLSGSTNALQTSFDENFSSAVFVRRRASVAGAGKEGIRQYGLAVTANQQVSAAVAMAFNCSVAAADAEAEMLKAISKSTVANPSPVVNAQTEAAANTAKEKAQMAEEAAQVAKEEAERAQRAADAQLGHARINAAAVAARQAADDALEAAAEAERIANPPAKQ